MSESTKHDAIYLQVCDDSMSEWYGEVTWCQDRVNDSDVKYIRADLVESLRQQLETERVRLAACGGVAMANTPESAAKAREMLPQYRSASCDDVAAAVDREMSLRQRLSNALGILDAETQIEAEANLFEIKKQLAAALAAIKVKDAAMKISFAPNGEDYKILNAALAIQPDDSALKAWLGEPIACRDDGRCQYAIDHGAEGLGHCPDGKCCMPLYSPKGMTK